MQVEQLGLSWIVVKNLKEAVKFYTEVVGLQLDVLEEQMGWAELHGKNGGGRLGIAQMSGHGEPIAPGQNAIVTFTVSHLEKALEEMKKKGAKLLGDIQEIPGHVKLQTVQDKDGNHFQMCQLLSMK